MKQVHFKYMLYSLLFLCLLMPIITISLPNKVLSVSSETMRSGISNKDVGDLINDNEQTTSSTPKLSQIIAWQPNGDIICNDPAEQDFQQICSDGAGGAIIVWKDSRNGNADIYAQKINSAGHTQWGNGSYWGGLEDRNGTVICNHPAGLEVPHICSDGLGGAIITWSDQRNGGDDDIYAQRINSTGHTQWGDGSYWGGLPDRNGTIICNNIDYQAFEGYLDICSDNASGAIITWVDERNSNFDIYAQRINSTGHTQWGDGSYWGGLEDRNGTVICNEVAGEHLNPRICSDNASGAIITWEDDRNGNADIYAQWINSTGHTQWGDGSYWGGLEDRNGTIICNEATWGQYSQQICSDEAGGAIITWQDKRNGGVNDIYAQRINSTGHTHWGDGSYWGGLEDRNGTVICNVTTLGQILPQICSDGAGGAIITWQDMRNGVNYDIYAQKIDSAGITHWGNGAYWGGLEDRNGTVICDEATSNQGMPRICSDEAGGAIIAWSDPRNSNYDVYAQHIDSNGITRWRDNGIAICDEATSDQGGQRICSDEAGGAIITWKDDRNGNPDIYAQKIMQDGGPSLPPAAGDDDDDDDDDEDTGAVVVVVVIIIIACVGGVIVVIIVLIKKGIIGTSRG